MASPLDRIIDGVSDPSVTTADLLRQVVVAAHRVKATAVRGWADRELAGLPNVDGGDLPVYRRGGTYPARATWAGPFGSSATTFLHGSDVSPQESDRVHLFFQVDFRQSVSELETLLAGQAEGELGIPWPAGAVAQWNRLAEAGRAARMSGMNLFGAKTLVPQSALAGVLDAVRTKALHFALDLQGVSTGAGEADGPTVLDDPAVGQVTTQFITNVYGGTPTFAQGTGFTQMVRVNDIESLMQAARTLGLDGPDLTEYIDAVLAERTDHEKGRLRGFLEKVGSGAIKVAGAVATKVATDQLTAYATAFLG